MSESDDEYVNVKPHYISPKAKIRLQYYRMKLEASNLLNSMRPKPEFSESNQSQEAFTKKQTFVVRGRPNWMKWKKSSGDSQPLQQQKKKELKKAKSTSKHKMSGDESDSDSGENRLTLSYAERYLDKPDVDENKSKRRHDKLKTKSKLRHFETVDKQEPSDENIPKRQRDGRPKSKRNLDFEILDSEPEEDGTSPPSSFERQRKHKKTKPRKKRSFLTKKKDQDCHSEGDCSEVVNAEENEVIEEPDLPTNEGDQSQSQSALTEENQVELEEQKQEQDVTVTERFEISAINGHIASILKKPVISAPKMLAEKDVIEEEEKVLPFPLRNKSKKRPVIKPQLIVESLSKLKSNFLSLGSRRRDPQKQMTREPINIQFGMQFRRPNDPGSFTRNSRNMKPPPPPRNDGGDPGIVYNVLNKFSRNMQTRRENATKRIVAKLQHYENNSQHQHAPPLMNYNYPLPEISHFTPARMNYEDEEYEPTEIINSAPTPTPIIYTAQEHYEPAEIINATIPYTSHDDGDFGDYDESLLYKPQSPFSAQFASLLRKV